MQKKLSSNHTAEALLLTSAAFISFSAGLHLAGKKEAASLVGKFATPIFLMGIYGKLLVNWTIKNKEQEYIPWL